jgi:nucleoredoxin
MPRLFLLFLALVMAAPAWAVAPPITVNDLALMVRGGYAEGEIVAEVQKRRLAAPIDAAVEKTLRERGVPVALITRLKDRNFLPTPEHEAMLAQQRSVALAHEQAESQLVEQRRAQAAALAKAAAARDNVMKLLDGKLMSLRGSELEPYPTSNLRDVRVFAFYFGSNWSPACREATPAIVEWYRATKAANSDFELIFVSSDRSALTMAEDVRKHAMPFPVVRFDSVNDAGIQQFGGNPTPWLGAVSRAGAPVTKNIGEKRFIDPGEIMRGLEFLLAEMRKPGARLNGE